jgi:hypothetical protein
VPPPPGAAPTAEYSVALAQATIDLFAQEEPPPPPAPAVVYVASTALPLKYCPPPPEKKPPPPPPPQAVVTVVLAHPEPPRAQPRPPVRAIRAPMLRARFPPLPPPHTLVPLMACRLNAGVSPKTTAPRNPCAYWVAPKPPPLLPDAVPL